MTDRREERTRGRRAAAEARRRQQRLRKIIAGALAVVVIGIIAFFVVREVTKEDTRVKTGIATEADAGQLMPEEGQDHTAGNVDYNTVPPTSGDHSANPLPWGVYDDAQSDERMVHSLEHGGVIIQYDCAKTDDCDALVEQITPLATKYSVKLIMAPRNDMEHMIALTAWTRLLTLDQFDAAAIDRFIEAYIDQGPEKFPSETQVIEQERQSGNP
jgi:hypothetical protein